MSGGSDSLSGENRRLKYELLRLQARLDALETSRWHRLNPRRLYRRQATPDRPVVGREAIVPGGHLSDDSTLARFRAEVLDRGSFTQVWGLRITRLWEPLLRGLEGRGARVLEIGSFEGLSTCWILWRLRDAHVTCVDTFEGSFELDASSIDPSRLKAVFDSNVALVDSSRVRTLIGGSRDVLGELVDAGERFDLAYVDGSHLCLDVLVDAALTWQLLPAGGLLVFDDYTWAILGDDPLLRPGPAIDAFLSVLDGRYERVFEGSQLAIRKTTDHA